MKPESWGRQEQIDRERIQDMATTMAWHSFLLEAGTARGPSVIAGSSPGVTLVRVSQMVVDWRCSRLCGKRQQSQLAAPPRRSQLGIVNWDVRINKLSAAQQPEE